MSNHRPEESISIRNLTVTASSAVFKSQKPEPERGFIFSIDDNDLKDGWLYIDSEQAVHLIRWLRQQMYLDSELDSKVEDNNPKVVPPSQ